jgi:Domain of unknown function (DUF6265)
MGLKVLVVVFGILLGCVPLACGADAVQLASLKWLAGSWQLQKPGKVIDEHWTTPAGGMMMGMSRTVAGEKTLSFEFVRIEQRGESLVYVAQPEGRPATEFTLESATENEVLFANLQHDFPKKIRYTRNADGSVTARIEDATGKKFVEFAYKAAK